MAFTRIVDQEIYNIIVQFCLYQANQIVILLFKCTPKKFILRIVVIQIKKMQQMIFFLIFFLSFISLFVYNIKFQTFGNNDDGELFSKVYTRKLYFIFFVCLCLFLYFMSLYQNFKPEFTHICSCQRHPEQRFWKSFSVSEDKQLIFSREQCWWLASFLQKQQKQQQNKTFLSQILMFFPLFFIKQQHLQQKETCLVAKLILFCVVFEGNTKLVQTRFDLDFQNSCQDRVKFVLNLLPQNFITRNSFIFLVLYPAFDSR
eukprot:TRINITY_DN2649_c0_g1_i3.p2 TRINITY_DN2649_c0_g1~~TRINITY_DN2649_c0_g1_i3.p2  ORF type:complete len:259 (+),score=-15.10 TRINITY_DN2649_c0_g1_i3:168-944(+)